MIGCLMIPFPYETGYNVRVKEQSNLYANYLDKSGRDGRVGMRWSHVLVLLRDLELDKDPSRPCCWLLMMMMTAQSPHWPRGRDEIDMTHVT